jgi:hypothetical protein
MVRKIETVKALGVVDEVIIDWSCLDATATEDDWISMPEFFRPLLAAAHAPGKERQRPEP